MGRSKPFIVAGSVLITSQASARADVPPQRIKLATPSAAAEAAAKDVMGRAFLHEEGAFPTRLQASELDLGSEGVSVPALAVVQMATCSNHACTYLILQRRQGRWSKLASFDSWASPYLGARAGAELKDIIYFDHVTDDCMACSPPQPVRLTWEPARQRYVRAGRLSPAEAQHYELTRIGE